METLDVINPYDGSTIDSIPLATEQEAQAALEIASALFADRKNWLSPYHRREILDNFAALVNERKESLASTIALEGGKPLCDARIEIDRAYQTIKIAIEEISRLTGTEIPMNLTRSSSGRMAYTMREPGGVVFAISAFNHPFNLVIHQVIPAIATSCPVIIKPASNTPLSCLAIVRLLNEAGLPDGWCQALICRSELTEKLVSDGRINFMTFVGSSKVGWYLRSKLAPGTSCALAHGGGGPVIFSADSEIEEALPLLIRGAFYHAGQVSGSVQRIYAHYKVAKTLAKRLAEAASELRVSDPRLETTEVGPLIDKREVKRVDDWVLQAVNSGAKLLCGGKRITDTCYAPTVLLDPPPDVKVSLGEVFGPVVCVYTCKELDDAIRGANSAPYIFQASVFTNNLETALSCIHNLDATSVMINDHTAFRVDWMPFGGRKLSGIGLSGVPYTMREMTTEKLMVFRSNTAIP